MLRIIGESLCGGDKRGHLKWGKILDHRQRDITVYCINTNEIPGELSRESLISSHVKITCYLDMCKCHRCYDYIINRAFHTKILLKWNGLVVHWCSYNKDYITWPLGDTKFLFSCHSKRNFVSPRGHLISSIYKSWLVLIPAGIPQTPT